MRTPRTSTGQLRLTTVGVQPDVELVWAIRGWFSNEQAVVPRELIYPPDQSEKQVEQQNAQEFASSQTSAETAALRELGYPVETFVDGGDSGRRRRSARWRRTTCSPPSTARR